MSQVSMSGSVSLYMQDSEYLKIQSELDQEKKRQLTKRDDETAGEDNSAKEAILERELKNREAEIDRQQAYKLEETDKKEQNSKDAEKEKTNTVNKSSANTDNNTVSEENVSATQNTQSSEEESAAATAKETEKNSVSEEKDAQQNIESRVDHLEMLQGYMESLQGMNVLGAMFLQRISQTSNEIRTDREDYGYSVSSKSLTEKEKARGDLEKRKQSVDDRTGKTLRDTFETLNSERTNQKKQESQKADEQQSNDRMTRMQNNLSGLQYANTVFSHAVNFVF